jgi:hypothetical protein
MLEIIRGYTVIVQKKTGDVSTPFFAIAGDGTKFFACKKKDAVAFKNELQRHINSKCVVAKSVIKLYTED